MSVPPADLTRLSEFDTPEVVAPAFRRFRLGFLGALLAVALASGFAGYKVDQTRTHDLRTLLRTADTLQTDPTPPADNVLPYFTMHGHLAAAAGVESCSAFAVRMTQRFLPDTWHFNAEDVAAVEAGNEIDVLRLEVGRDIPWRWQC